MDKPVAPSCERNKDPILEQLKLILREDDKRVFEVGSGTGQHALFFAEIFPSLIWQTSDLEENHDGINLWIKESSINNVLAPVYYQAGETAWPNGEYDVVFTANSLHIMSWSNCLSLFQDLKQLQLQSRFVVYGPFNYNGQFTSESNEKFESWLKQQNKDSGIRDFESVVSQLEKSGFILLKDIEMPANNRMLVFEKAKN